MAGRVLFLFTSPAKIVIDEPWEVVTMHGFGTKKLPAKFVGFV
jgi:hypothetical protein